jgi:hypothetical protein
VVCPQDHPDLELWAGQLIFYVSEPMTCKAAASAILHFHAVYFMMMWAGGHWSGIVLVGNTQGTEDPPRISLGGRKDLTLSFSPIGVLLLSQDEIHHNKAYFFWSSWALAYVSIRGFSTETDVHWVARTGPI